MADFQNEDVVEVIATGKRGRIEITRTDEKMENLYWVEFDRTFSTREWFNGNQLRLISRSQDRHEPGFYPDAPISGD